MVDTHFTEEYLNNAIESDIADVASIQRMNRKITGTDRKDQLVDRQIIIVTYVGNCLPEKVRINLSYFPVEPYVHPVVQCFRCFRYGHTMKLCKAKEHRCKKCTQFTISFKEGQTIINNPSYAKITINNRFDLLRNDENFPLTLAELF